MNLPARSLILFAVALLLSLAIVAQRHFLPTSSVVAQVQRPSIKFDRDDYDPQIAISRGFKPIIEPAFVSANEAKQKLQPNELVLGVSVNGKPRAYPINMLTGPSREIFNDKLGGKFIAATW